MTRKTRSRNRRLAASARILVALAMLLALPLGASAQGCSMCRETAGFQKDRAVGALKRGIVALAIPPAGIAVGLVWLTWKRANRFASS